MFFMMSAANSVKRLKSDTLQF